MPSAITAIRLLLLTGCRKMEIVTLRWDDIDRAVSELRLSDGKTGPRRVPLTPAVKWVLDRTPRIEDNPYVFAGEEPGAHVTNLDGVWRRLRVRADVEDMRIHDVRHSYTSRALALGEGLPMIGRLLGNTQMETTARYAHLAEGSVKEAALRVSESTAADMLKGYSG